MATMKITVDELSYLKTIYSKAAKNLRDVIAVVKKAKNSIGNDRMFEEARSSLGKLAENMDRRATVLEALAEALTYSGDTYKGGQKRAVSSISDYKAHKTDFYGNPVHVSGAAGGKAAAAAGGAAAAAGGASAGGSATTGGHTGGGTTANTNTTTATPSHSAGSTGGGSTASSGHTTVTSAPETAASGADSAAAGAATGAGVETAAAAGGAGLGGAAMFGLGAAAATAVGGATIGATKVAKKKKQENSIDNQLEAAKKKLEAIEKEQDGIRASLAEDEE